MLLVKQSMKSLNMKYGVILSSIVINILNVAFPVAIIQLYDRVIPNKSTESLVIISIFVMSIVIIDHLLKYLRGLIISWDDHVRLEVKNIDIIKSLLKTPLDKLPSIPIPNIINKLNLFKEAAESISIRKTILKIDMVFIIFFSAILFLISPILFLCLTSIGAVFLHTYYLVNKSKKSLSLEAEKVKNKYSYFSYSLLSSMHTIKSSGIQRSVSQLEGEAFRKILFWEQKEKFLSMLMQAFMRLFTKLNVISVMLLSAILIIDQKLSMGAMGACIIISNKIFAPIMKYIDMDTREKDIEKMIDSTTEDESSPIEDKLEEIKLDDVTIKYEDPDITIIENFSCTAKTGDIILLEGPKGSGRTSFSKVFSGLQKPCTGRVTARSDSPSLYSINQFRSKVAYVSDTLKLFNGTILENLTLFDSSKSSQAKNICLKLGSYEIINNLPNGLLSQIGQGEIDVISHGTKQQISMARALLQSPEILIIDDACLGIDKTRMKKIASYLKETSKDKIILITSSNQYLRSIANREINIGKSTVRDIKKEIQNAS